jgi:O-antigen ligase
LLHLRWRSIAIISAALLAGAALAWQASPQLRKTADTFASDYTRYVEKGEPTSLGLRLEFWRKSLGFFAEAPIKGHGTGSTRGLFEQVKTGSGYQASAEVIGNPHNQTLNVAVQWGALGVLVLYALWFAHLSLFRGEGLACWVGLLVVVQNMLSSLLNSHLFDFAEGWIYVLGVGVAGGMARAAKTIRS